MVCVLLGPPGSGKGTQAALLKPRLGVPHISTGDLLRAEAEADTPLGRKLASTLAAGELVSDEMTHRVLEQRLRAPDAKRGAILDGYPRTVAQAQDLDALLAAAGTRIDVILVFDVDEQSLMDRLLRRAEEQHRTDDNPASIAERFKEYHRLTRPVIDYYRSQKHPVVEIDGSGSPEAVQERIVEALERIRGTAS